MLEEFDKIIYEFGNLNDNDGYDEELDILSDKLNDLLKNMSVIEIQELLKRPYMGLYKELIKELLINNNRWEEEYYGWKERGKFRRKLRKIRKYR